MFLTTEDVKRGEKGGALSSSVRSLETTKQSYIQNVTNSVNKIIKKYLISMFKKKNLQFIE